jgi:hypothetical protein
LSAYEFAEYRAYFSIEPYPEMRADIRNAQVCATVANSTPFRNKKQKPVPTSDFIIDWWNRDRQPVMDVEEMKNHAKAWTVANRGKVWEPKQESD